MPLPSSSTFVVIRLLAAGWLVAAAAVGQRVRVATPLGALAPTPQTSSPQTNSNDDPGVAVDMFENPNLDRFLWRAKGCLEREDFMTAINLLQQVIEGRTSEVVLEPGEPTPPGEKEPGKEPAKEAAKEPVKPEKPDRAKQVLANRGTPATKPEAKQPELDARNTVFSQDGRLYRPVSRLCHELLARMPAAGLEIYRTNHEVAAEQMLQQALADGSITALEHVADRYFVTLPAGRAMALLADRLMHEGRYRAAVVVLRDLLEVYPAEHRQRLGISDVWCRFKIALCLALAGENATALEAVTALAQAYPLESLRVQGDLYAVKDLPSDQLFARDVATIAAAPRPRAASCLDEPDCQLLPLWQFRFGNSEPYKEPKPSNDRNNGIVWSDGGMTTAVMPFAGRYGPGTCVTFGGLDASGLPQVLFLEHFRLRSADATNGLLAAQSEGVEQPPTAKDGAPRVRIAANDFALLRPVFDGARCYVITGYRTQSTSTEVLKASELSALQPDTLQKLWSSSQWLDGDAGLRDVTFLAAPTVFGERLLLPALRRGKYSLECLERETGRPLWNVPIHAGGTPFWKAPGCPVVVQGGIAYVVTNAGCVASVDAFTGDLRWIRRYERTDPLHKRGKTKRPARNDEMMAMQGQQFRQDELPGFVPNDMFAINGLLILAACDSDMLLGIDGATGQPQWMLDGTLTFAPYGKLRALVGLIGDDLFALSDSHVVAIGANGGLVKWARELPAWNGPKQAGRGRGTVAGNRVLIPGEHEILAYTTDGELAGRIALPAFDSSREPLGGSAHLFADGAWLAVGYQGGIEMFSTTKALRHLADGTTDTSRKADLLLRSGDGDAAIEVLSAAIRGTQDAHQLRQFGRELLAIVRERAYATARTGDCSEALQLLDRYEELLREPGVRMLWHLARVELCKERGDLLAHEREQNRLYSFMEGKG